MSSFLDYVISLSPFLLTAQAAKATDPRKPPKNAVLLSTVNSLTLRAGKQTSSRRTSPVPQLVCTGPAQVCKLYTVDVMRCTNEGSDYDKENVQWACKASLPEEFKLGATEVSCEGYASSEDPFVLKGSCGVEYRLLLTEKGEERYGVKNERSVWDEMGDGHGLSSKVYSLIFMALFAGILFLIARSFLRSWRDAPRLAANPTGFGWGGGGGGGGGDDPPPPYDYFPDSRPPKKPSTRSYNPRTSTAGSSRAAAGEQWRPGFWTGAAAGAAGAYMAGRGNRTPAQTQPETRQRGGGLFGGWGGGGNAGPSASVSSSSRSPSYSSSRHESSGFGGTSRR